MHGKRTVIEVAHRLVTVAHADHIYVIENGHLSEEGTHKQLRKGQGVIQSSLCETKPIRVTTVLNK